MFERFSPKALKAVMFSQEEARRSNANIVNTDHLLLGILRDEGSIPFAVLQQKGVDIPMIYQTLSHSNANVRRSQAMEVHFSEQVRIIFDLAEEEQDILNDQEVDSEHLFLGLMQLGEGQGIRILKDAGLQLLRLRWMVLRTRRERTVENVRTPNLDRYGEDWTRMLEQDQTLQVVEWRPMIEKMLKQLGLLRKHSVLLVGESGVGKTSLIYGLTQFVLDSKIYEQFAHYRIVSLGIDRLMAQASSNESLHEQIKQIMVEIRQADDIILVIENIHQLFLADKKEMEFVITQQLITWLEDEQAYCIATTTPQFYHQLISQGTLQHYFQVMFLSEPPEIFCIRVLKHWQESLEAHHHLQMAEDALHKAVDGASRFERGKSLPEAALTFLDYAAAHKRWQRTIGVFSAKRAERKLRRLREKRELYAANSDKKMLDKIKQEILQTEGLLEKYNRLAAKEAELKLTGQDLETHVISEDCVNSD